MRRISILVLGAVALCFGMLASATEKLPIETFFKKFEFAQMTLSPDGKKLAALAPYEDRYNLFVIDLEADTMAARRITNMTNRDINFFMWGNNERLLFQMDKDGNESFGLWAVDHDGKRAMVLAPAADTQISGGSFVVKQTFILDVLKDDDKHVIVTNNDRLSAYPDVYRMNIYSGRKIAIERNNGMITSWFTDHKGRLRGAVETEALITRVLMRADEEAEWETVIEFSLGDFAFIPVALSYDEKTLYVTSNLTPDGEHRDMAGLYTFDLATKTLGELIYEVDGVDCCEVIQSDHSEKLIGITYNTDKPQVQWLDEKFAGIQASLDAALPDMINDFASMDRNETKAIIRSWNSRTPGTYYLMDLETSSMKEMAELADWINPAQMAEMRPISYQSRDGLTINGYLTLPPGSDGKNLPLIVHPHGGPWARDGYNFNRAIQFFANRGYAVLQMNFRGSTGYGKSFLEASWKQWGQTMQNDITDGLAWAVEQGIADPERVCIYGGSYGGYATMAGLTFTPDLYKCGINYVGVTDIALLFDTMPKTWEAVREAFKVTVGDPDTEKEFLDQWSPVNHVEKIQAPIFMAYGKQDPRVVLKHAENLEKELKKYNKPYQLMVKKDEGHGYRKLENQLDFYGTMEIFLAANIGN